jgi:hypothetical protein
MQPNRLEAENGAAPAPGRTRRNRALHRRLDGRSRVGKRAIELVRAFERELGGNLSEGQRLAVTRAATMAAIAEDARTRRANGDRAVNLTDLVRLDRVSALAIRQLGIGAKREPDPARALEDHLLAKQNGGSGDDQ